MPLPTNPQVGNVKATPLAAGSAAVPRAVRDRLYARDFRAGLRQGAVLG